MLTKRGERILRLMPGDWLVRLPFVEVPMKVFRGIVVIYAVAWVALFLAAMGCESEPEPAKRICSGVMVGEQCLQKCDSNQCAPGNECVFPTNAPQGLCARPCDSIIDCPYGFACSELVESEETTKTYCVSQNLNDNGAPGVSCASHEQCDKLHGLSCFDGACRFACDSRNAKCPDKQMCRADPDAPAGKLQGYCVDAIDDLGVEGRYGADCPFGNEQCDQGAGFVCVGAQATADAYCTKTDGCTVDDDCPTGYWCGALRTPKGDKDVDFTKQPTACLRSTFCHPCRSDLDCFHVDGAVCVASENGEKFCSMLCSQGELGCPIGSQCKTMKDGRDACIPEIGACYSKQPTGCSPCRIDTDCGANALCMRGKWGYKPTINWCLTPCGGPNEHGKNTCPVAPNGLEMLCLDENMYALGGPFSAQDPSYIFKHCYAPFSADNSSLFPGQPPVSNICGNARVEGDEQCDSMYTHAKSGCQDCKITERCTFRMNEPNDDEHPSLTPAPKHFSVESDSDPAVEHMIDTSVCNTFKIEGTIDTEGDNDVALFHLYDSGSMWIDVYSDIARNCNDDLVAEVRPWKESLQTSAPALFDVNIPCEKLSSEIKDLEEQRLCPGGFLGCGSCKTNAFVCGICDDDSGIGDCPRLLVMSQVSYGSYEIKNDSIYKMLRIYAKNPKAKKIPYVIVGNRFATRSKRSTPPVLSCF